MILYVLHWSFPGVSDVWSILLPFFTTASQKGEESWYISGAKWSSSETHTGEYKTNIIYLCYFSLILSLHIHIMFYYNTLSHSYRL